VAAVSFPRLPAATQPVRSLLCQSAHVLLGHVIEPGNSDEIMKELIGHDLR
jgi:hypothetical protein